MIKVWGRRNSINVQKVLWAAVEVGVEYEQIDVGGQFGGLDTEEYDALNPNRRVPTLQDGKTVIWESNVIVRYLARKYGAGTLWPEDPETGAVADMWMEWKQTTLMKDLTTVFWGLIRTPPEERDKTAIENSAKELGKLFSRLDEHLKDRPFVAGETFTMGDIPAGAAADRYYQLDCWHPSLPRLEAWRARLAERPGFREHVSGVPLT